MHEKPCLIPILIPEVYKCNLVLPWLRSLYRNVRGYLQAITKFPFTVFTSEYHKYYTLRAVFLSPWYCAYSAWYWIMQTNNGYTDGCKFCRRISFTWRAVFFLLYQESQIDIIKAFNYSTYRYLDDLLKNDYAYFEKKKIQKTYQKQLQVSISCFPIPNLAPLSGKHTDKVLDVRLLHYAFVIILSTETGRYKAKNTQTGEIFLFSQKRGIGKYTLNNRLYSVVDLIFRLCFWYELILIYWFESIS